MKELYNLNQGVNQIKIPTLNKNIKVSDYSGLKKNNDMFEIMKKENIENIAIEPNWGNFRNNSLTSVLYFYSSQNVSRETFLFKLYPNSEINFFLHENKNLYCYLFQKNETNVQVNVKYYNSKYDRFFEHSISDKKYECLEIIDGTIADSGNSEITIKDIAWINQGRITVKSDKDFSVAIYYIDGFGNESEKIYQAPSNSSSSDFQSFSFNDFATEYVVPISHGIKVRIENDGTGVATVESYLELFGG